MKQTNQAVIPAKAGIQRKPWISAFAGMTQTKYLFSYKSGVRRWNKGHERSSVKTVRRRTCAVAREDHRHLYAAHRRQRARLAVGADRVPRLPDPAGNLAAGLQLWPTPRVRRGPYRGDR